MRVTIDIPDETFMSMKRTALVSNKTVEQLVLEGLDLLLKQFAPNPPSKLRKLPLIRSQNPGSLMLGEEGVYEYIDFP